VIATKHGKERLFGQPIKISLGLSIACPENIETDQLGTFTGEVERTATPGEAALRKARLGIAMTGMQLGLASEGSFGPHPALPFLAVDHELVVFIDTICASRASTVLGRTSAKQRREEGDESKAVPEIDLLSLSRRHCPPLWTAENRLSP
jgi:hypothetical protein